MLEACPFHAAALDDNPADVDGNDDRLSRAVESAKSLAAPARQPGAAASVGQGGTETEAQFADVASDANYIKLARLMEPFTTSIGSGTDEKKKALTALLKDQSAAGVYFVLKTTKTLDSQAPFKSLTGLKISSGTEVLQQVYNDALSLDGDGKKVQWGLLITAADAAKLVKGHVECNKGSDGVDWWSLLRNTIIRRDGQQAAHRRRASRTGRQALLTHCLQHFSPARHQVELCTLCGIGPSKRQADARGRAGEHDRL